MKDIPVVYVLMPEKGMDNYCGVFATLLHQLPDLLACVTNTVDYEVGISDKHLLKQRSRLRGLTIMINNETNGV